MSSSPLYIYNSLSGKKEVFEPINSPFVGLYVCGPTVYNEAHLGNIRTFLTFDIVYRYLTHLGYKVRYVRNITDVGHLVDDVDFGEDKIEKRARLEKIEPMEIVQKYTNSFHHTTQLFNLISPNIEPSATGHIIEQIEMIQKILTNGYAYEINGSVYFDVKKYAERYNYGELSGRKLDELLEQTRENLEGGDEKRFFADFAIWKKASPETIMKWNSPWGVGVPGWHLECSAMAMSILGPTIDIHTGGIDHIPVHHTNEIAQSEAASGKKFANLWLHNNHLKIDGGKISKSLGNGHTLQDLADEGFLPMDLRMFVLQSQFMTEGNFTFDNLQAAKNRRDNWRNYAVLRHQTHDSLSGDDTKNDDEKYPSLQASAGALREALLNNLNTPEMMRIVDASFSQLDRQPLGTIHRHGLIELLTAIDELLGLQLIASTPDVDDEAKRIILERQRAREAKDWNKSDALRDQLLEKGIEVKDSPSGVIWTYAPN